MKRHSDYNRSGIFVIVQYWIRNDCQIMPYLGLIGGISSAPLTKSITPESSYNFSYKYISR